MATNAENLTLMMLRLGSRSSPTLRAQLVLELNKAIRELERGPTKPWFMEDRLEGVLVVDQDYIAIPTTFLEEVEEGSLRLYNPECLKWKALLKKDYDQIQCLSENTVSALPTAYALYGEKVYFSHIAKAAYAYRWEAFVRTTEIADNASATTNKWLLEFFDFTSLYALDKVARLHIRAMEVIQSLQQPLKTAADAFWRSCEARQQANRNYEQE